MALASMTGFSRVEGASGLVRWTWELRSVNGKNLDIRIRIPSGLEELESVIRKVCGDALKRGNVTVGLSMQREAGDMELQVNEHALESVLTAVKLLHRRVPDAAPATLDGILAHKGVLELKEPVEDEATRAVMIGELQRTLDEAVKGLVEMRESEGAKIEAVVAGQVSEIERLAKAAEAHPGRSPEAIRERLTAQVADLMGASGGALDPQRLHQEAVLLATKADIREELDRLFAHVKAARELFASGGAIGRKLDFLAQEFNREANTLCSKSNAVELTSIGLDLKSVIDQLREQIQNLE